MQIFLIHQFLEKIRSVFRAGHMLANVFVGFLLVLIIAYLVFIGLFLDVILLAVYPDGDIVRKVTELLFYYLPTDLILRFLFQGSSSISVDHYRLLPIKRAKLILYSLWKSLFSLLNLLPLILLGSFLVKVVWPDEGAVFSIAWLVVFICLVGINHYLNFSIRMFFVARPILIFLLFAGITALIYFEYNGILGVSRHFGRFVYFIVNHPFLLVIPLSGLAIAFRLAHSIIADRMYEESTDDGGGRLIVKNDFSSGTVLDYLRLELLMIFRNKRSKATLLVSVIFTLYGFMFYANPIGSNDLVLMLYSALLSGMFPVQYGQFLFAWESSYFDFVASKNIPAKKYIESKLLLLVVLSFAGFVLTTPYVLFGIKILYYHAMCMLFHAGISSYIMIFFGLYNTKRIDLGKGVFMNYQGVSSHQFILILPLLGIPALILWIGNLAGLSGLGPVIVGALGLTGLLFRNYVCEYFAKRFISKKYVLADGFRK